MIRRLDRLVDERRVFSYALIAIALYLAVGLLWPSLGKNRAVPPGKQIAYGFVPAYAAAKLALARQAFEASALPKIAAAERATIRPSDGIFLISYPPTYHLILAPLALLPYRTACLLFIGASFLAYLGLMRSLYDHRLAPVLAAAFPAAFINAFHGQNAFLNTTLIGLGLLLLERRPLTAGALLGLLAYKPQIGLIVPFVLIAGGHWWGLAAATVTAFTLATVATSVFGNEHWLAFWQNLPHITALMETGVLPWDRMPTVFAAASLFGAPARTAHGLHAAVALTVLAATIIAWRWPGPLDLKAALAVTASALLTPFLFDFDLVLLALPMGLMARHALESAGEVRGRFVLLLLALAPVAGPPLAERYGIQLMPAATLVLFLMVWSALAEERTRFLMNPPLRNCQIAAA